ncbi:hypothetical protein M8J76_010588 [Diaphorina citri]|nr:hypothetical protein M8J76_010588 [Diaphorina citri]
MDPDKVTLDTLIDNIKLVLKKCLISSPVYGNLQRQLAEYLFESNKPLEGVVQLVESLGGKYKFDHLKLEQEYVLSGGAKNEENIQNYENVKVFNSVPLEYLTPQAFLSDLNSLPAEWTLVQISRKPQCQEILQGVREHMTGQIDCRLDEARLVVMSSGEMPIQVLVDKPLGSDENMKTYFDLVNEALAKLSVVSGGRSSREEASLGECWLREFQCLLPGKLKSPGLNALISHTLDTISSSLVTMETEARHFLHRLLAGVHLISEKQVYALVLSYVTKNDELLAEHITQSDEYSEALSSASRYPVILILEDELDRLPWETSLCLRTSPVTRVHCFQFVLALLRLHGSKVDKDGVRTSSIINGYLSIPRIGHDQDTFVILNPSSDIPALETKFKTFLDTKFGKWKGIIGRAPSTSEFIDGLNHPLFIYCGHGNGTYYASSDKIGRGRIRAVSCLFGCRSVERVCHGGRVPFSSVVQKYFIAGSPCVLGNLWNVSSTDCDRLASNLLNLTFPSSPSSLPLDLSTISKTWWSVPPFPASMSTNSDSVSHLSSNGVASSNSAKALVNSMNSGDSVKPSTDSTKPPVNSTKTVVVNSTKPSNDSTKTFVNSTKQSINSTKISADPPPSKPSAKSTSSTNPTKLSSSNPGAKPSCTNPTKSSASSLSYSPDLCANVQWARQGANYFVNGSALVVWGLPVWFEDSPLI